MSEAQALLAAALKLPARDRIMLIHALDMSLETQDIAENRADLTAELNRRSEEALESSRTTVPLSQLFQFMRGAESEDDSTT